MKMEYVNSESIVDGCSVCPENLIIKIQNLVQFNRPKVKIRNHDEASLWTSLPMLNVIVSIDDDSLLLLLKLPSWYFPGLQNNFTQSFLNRLPAMQ